MAGQIKKRHAKIKATEHVLSILELGWHGDGVAKIDGKKVYAPFTLAGESVRAAVSGSRAVVLEIVEPSSERNEPACPHFSQCGGCAVQHLTAASYTHWKRQIIVTALANRNVEASVAPLIDAHGIGRRRATLHVRYQDGKILAGYMRAGSHKLLDLDQCPILAPELFRATTIARDLARALERNLKPLDVQLTATDTGLDCVIRGCIEFDLDARMDLSNCANTHDLARLSLNGELLLERRAPILTFGLAKVVLPPGGFLQATKTGEETLADLVLEAVGKANKVADLYCGVGPFALRLAKTSSVVAIDNDSASIAALKNAADHTTGQKPVVTGIRDLAKNPLCEDELKDFDAVVFDPPRAGAGAQVLEIVEAKVQTVIAVSCNPATFAHDAFILTRGGYVLEKVIPIDQFRYAANVELIGVFKRNPTLL